MRTWLMRLLIHPMEGVSPRVVELREPILAVGLETETNTRTAFRDVAALGRRYRHLKAAHGLEYLKDPQVFVALSDGYDASSGAFTYRMGDVVSRVGRMPPGLEAFEVPALTYAVFPVRPRNRFGWGIAIAAAKSYAYIRWMPTSGYRPAGIVDDFEYHDERSRRRRRPEIDLYVAVAPADPKAE
jgi:predicted transcriptional regulator YdeE